MADIVCPFTLRPLASSKREDVAVIYQSNPLASSGTECGHSCSLAPLVSHLHDSGGSKTCPVCQKSPASVVCDADSSAYLLRRNADGGDAKQEDDEGGVVSFRYGTVSYFLWVRSKFPSQTSYSKIFSQKGSTALDRIGSVLGMDVISGMKVIHKGKVVYPAGAKQCESPDEISAQLMDISSTDLLHRRKKPSLVVTGLRKPLAASGNQQTASTIFFSIVRRLTPRYFCNMALWILHYTFRTTTSVVGGISLFIRSLLYPPQPQT